jgi:uncharacterized protein YdaL
MQGPRLPAGKWLLAFVISATLVVTAHILVSPTFTSVSNASLPELKHHAWANCAAGAPTAGSVGRRRVLVLYDSGGNGTDAGIVYATLMGNLASHFGSVRLAEARKYRAGEILRYDALVYVGSKYGQVLPVAFLNDVNAGVRPVLWLKENIYQLAPIDRFQREYGWLWKNFDGPAKFTVKYKTALLHPSDSGAGLTTFTAIDESKVRTLATASGPGFGTIPWAVRSRNLTYVGDLPLGTSSTGDASLALADLLHDLLPAPDARTLNRHRALVRIEDIGPMSNPADLRDVAKAMRVRGVPYSIAVYPVYVGPITRGGQKVVHLAQRPEVVKAIVEMLDGGASLVLHGYTHQLGNLKNPRSGESGTDYEFFRAHLDAHGLVVYDGAVPGDSTAWADKRLDQALAELSAVGLPRPQMFNVPHYAATALDYAAIKSRFAARYDRGQYFAPSWDGSSPASPYMSEQSAPWVIRDEYGSLVVPENLGYVTDVAAARGPNTKADILAGAGEMLAVRDSVASFFYHPFLGSSGLVDLVEGMQRMGYTFVSPCDL